MKLADSMSYHHLEYDNDVLTIGGCVHDDEAGIDPGGLVPVSEIDSVCVTAKTLVGFIEVNLMIGTFQRPQSGNT